MNYRGYKHFAEQVYEGLFLNQDKIAIDINPLLTKPKYEDFYKSKNTIEESIEWQKKRIEEYEGSSFELIHLGHIYTEVGETELAKQYYQEALISSGYAENNSIITPIINWYLKNGTRDQAIAICDEILLHSPDNSIARWYRKWITTEFETRS